MKEGLVHLPAGIVILRERRNKKGRITSLVKWPLSKIPDSEASKINTSISQIEQSESPSACRFHHTDYRSETGRITYRIARNGSWAATNIR